MRDPIALTLLALTAVVILVVGYLLWLDWRRDG